MCVTVVDVTQWGYGSNLACMSTNMYMNRVHMPISHIASILEAENQKKMYVYLSPVLLTVNALSQTLYHMWDRSTQYYNDIH